VIAAQNLVSHKSCINFAMDLNRGTQTQEKATVIWTWIADTAAPSAASEATTTTVSHNNNITG